MLRALAERGIVPELVLGTSIGAINGVAIAADPTPAGVERLTSMWSAIDSSTVFAGSVLGRIATLARTAVTQRGATLTIGPARGRFAGLPARRSYELRLAGHDRPRRVVVGGRRTRAWTYDEARRTVVVRTRALPTRRATRIVVR